MFRQKNYKPFKLVFKNEAQKLEIELLDDCLYLLDGNQSTKICKEDLCKIFENKDAWEKYFINGPVDYSLKEFLTDGDLNLLSDCMTDCEVKVNLPWNKQDKALDIVKVEKKFRHSFKTLGKSKLLKNTRKRSKPDICFKAIASMKRPSKIVMSPVVINKFKKDLFKSERPSIFNTPISLKKLPEKYSEKSRLKANNERVECVESRSSETEPSSPLKKKSTNSIIVENTELVEILKPQDESCKEDKNAELRHESESDSSCSFDKMKTYAASTAGSEFTQVEMLDFYKPFKAQSSQICFKEEENISNQNCKNSQELSVQKSNLLEVFLQHSSQPCTEPLQTEMVEGNPSSEVAALAPFISEVALNCNTPVEAKYISPAPNDNLPENADTAIIDNKRPKCHNVSHGSTSTCIVNDGETEDCKLFPEVTTEEHAEISEIAADTCFKNDIVSLFQEKPQAEEILDHIVHSTNEITGPDCSFIAESQISKTSQESHSDSRNSSKAISESTNNDIPVEVGPEIKGESSSDRLVVETCDPAKVEAEVFGEEENNQDSESLICCPCKVSMVNSVYLG
eukprot:NODE_64_length_26047_cov_1.706837.p4 type:complete len:569 gc:universal NODE_64_length_26047_cov_1.706837:12239-10533(-)